MFGVAGPVGDPKRRNSQVRLFGEEVVGVTRIYEQQRSPSAELMGSEFVSFDPVKGELTTRFTPPPGFASPRGAVQGGLIAGFLDEVMGGALLAVTDRNEYGQKLPLNLDMNLTFCAWSRCRRSSLGDALSSAAPASFFSRANCSMRVVICLLAQHLLLLRRTCRHEL